jgi:hypothetical protein
MDFHEKNGFMTAEHLFALFSKSGLRLSRGSRNLIIRNYALSEGDASTIRPVRSCHALFYSHPDYIGYCFV